MFLLQEDEGCGMCRSLNPWIRILERLGRWVAAFTATADGAVNEEARTTTPLQMDSGGLPAAEPGDADFAQAE